MQRVWKKLILGAMLGLGVLAPAATMVVSEPVMAADCVETNLFGCVPTDEQGSGIKQLLSLVVTILLYGIGVAAVIGVVIAGILYLTSRDDVAQAEKAKKRLVEVVIGLVAWALLFTILQWLIPNFTESTLESSYVVTNSLLV